MLKSADDAEECGRRRRTTRMKARVTQMRRTIQIKKNKADEYERRTTRIKENGA
jgi:hypothetical protein